MTIARDSFTRADSDSPETSADERVEIAISSEEPYRRWFGIEVLGHGKDEVDLTYFNAGGAVCCDHDTRDQVGVLEEVSLGKDGVLRGKVLWSDSPRAQQIRADVLKGIRRFVSVGYKVSEMQMVKDDEDEGPTYRVTKWTPLEASFVAVPADITVGVGRSADEAAFPVQVRNLAAAPKAKEQTVSEQNTAAPDGAATNTRTVSVAATESERTRAAEIVGLANEHGLADRASKWLSEGRSIEQVTKEIIDVLRERRSKPIVAGGVTPGVDGISEKDAKRYSFARAILKDVEGFKHLDAGLEREVEQAIEKNLPKEYHRRGGILVPTRLTRAGLDASTATKGPELNFTQAGEFIEMLRNRVKALSMGVKMLSGLTGPVSFPKQNAAASGSWVGENPGVDVADSNLLLTTVSLAIKTYQASTSFSRQLLVSALSASVDAEQLVREDLAKVHGLALDAAILNGSGAANQPRGILNTVGIGSVAVGVNGGVPTFDHVVDLETAIADANADADVMGYITTPGIRGKLKKTQEFNGTNGVGIWLDGQVNGFRAEATKQMPQALVKGTSVDCHAILFGCFEEAVCGEFGVLEMIVDPFRLKKQGMIEVTSFQMADVAVRYAEAFAAIKDARVA